MIINTFYLSSFFLSLIIIHLYIIDFKKFNIKLYEEINQKAWIKIYVFVNIAIIHIIWLCSTLFLDYKDNTIIYGVPLFLFIPYLIYIIDDFKKEENETNVSIKINKYLNYLISIYIIILIIFIIIPLKIKINFFNYLQKIIDKIL
jgi:hypothetical protein